MIAFSALKAPARGLGRPGALAFTCLVLLVSSSRAQELLVNGGAEAALTGDAIPGWTAVDGVWQATEGKKRLPPIRGKRYLRAGRCTSARLEQTVALPRGPSSGRRFLRLGAWSRNDEGRDHFELGLAVLDVRGAVVAEVKSGARKHREWQREYLLLPVPESGRSARVSLTGRRRRGRLNDAFFDDVSLRVLDEDGCEEASLEEIAGRIGKLSDRGSADAMDLAFAVACAREKRAGTWLEKWVDAEPDAAIKRALLQALSVRGGASIRARLREMASGKVAGDATFALDLMPLVDPQWRQWVSHAVSEAKAGAARSRLLASLCRSGDARSLKHALALWNEGDARLKSDLLTLLGKTQSVDRIYESFLNPVLDPEASVSLRQKALQILSEQRDTRFFRHVRLLREIETDGPRRGRWVNWALFYDSVRAIEECLPLLRDGHPAVAGAFAKAARRLKSPEVTAWFRSRGLSSDIKAVRLAAVNHLGRKGEAEDHARLIELSGDRNDDVALAAISALGGLPASVSQERLERLLTHRDARRAAGAMDGLWRQGGGEGECLDLVRRVAERTRTPELKAAAFALLQEKHAPRIRRTIREAFAHRSPRVRIAAFEAATWLREVDTVDALLERLEREKGSPKHHLVAALRDLTGYDWGTNPARWYEWWNRRRDGFVFGPRGRGAKASISETTYARYYGIPIRADNIVFVIDTSGSMAVKKGGQTRLQKAKIELLKVLESLGPGQSFNIISFSDGPVAFERRLVAARPQMIQRAARWLVKLKAAGSTNIHDSLEMALAQRGVESIFLLSDGEPSTGKVVAMKEIRRVIKQYNRLLRVRIHTIGIAGTDRMNAFLAGLAGDNDGDFAKTK